MILNIETKTQKYEIYYEVCGEGEPFLMLHGWGSNLENFRSLIEEYSQKYKVYAFDFPGFGNSPEPRQAIDIEEFAEITKIFMDTLEISRPIILSHSFGTRVAILLANKRQIPKMIITGGAGIKPKRPTSYYLKVYSFKLMKFLAKLPILQPIYLDMIEDYKRKYGSSDYNTATPTMRATLSKVVNQDLKPKLKNIKSSTLLIWGSNDEATPLEDGKTMERLIPDSGLAIIKNASHYAFLDNPTLFITITNKFLDEE